MRELLFVCCTPGRKEDTILYRSLVKLGKHRSVFFEQAHSKYASCFNHALKEFAKPGQIVVFTREDVLISDLFVQEKLTQAFDTLGFSVVGVAGSVTFTMDESLPTTSWQQSPPQNLSGAIEYSTRGVQSVWRSFGLAPARCIVLDNALLAVDPNRIGAVRFDERFEVFFYELDFCLTANFSGLALGTSNIYINRKPEGLFENPHYQAAQRVFRAKWRDRIRASAVT
jgi:hypothetical protein